MKAIATVNLEEFRVTGHYPHFIGVWTCGMMELAGEDREVIEGVFNKAPKGDHFYSINLGERKFFVVENGERGYTAMLPEEY